jgi:adenine-specific DNA-methyltransferase
MKEKARGLRKNQTDAERLLWHHLRNRRLAGHKFRRQHPIGPFIVDFACVEEHLVIELDGGQHAIQIEHDGQRSMRLELRGYQVMRFWNDQVLKDVQVVLEMILRTLETEPPHPNPLPQKNGGEGAVGN